MTTIVNSPPSDSGNTMGVIVALILIMIIAALFFVYGLPALRQANTQPTIQIPDKVDVNIQNPANQQQ